MNKYTALFAFLVINLNILAQDVSPSPYSFYGLGDSTFSGNSENVSMGGISVFSDSLHYNINDPASLSRLKYINLSLGMNNRFINMSDNNESIWRSSHYLNYFALGIPIGKKIGFGFGFIPEKSTGYQIYNKCDLGTYIFKGNGGISRFFVSGSYKINKEISLGFEYQYHFGFIQHEYMWLPEDDYTTYTWENNYMDISGNTFKFSADYIKQITKNNFIKAQIGYQSDNYLSASGTGSVRLLHLNSSGQQETVSITDKPEKKEKILLPFIIDVGLGYGYQNKWFIGSNISYIPLKSFKNNIYNTKNIMYKESISYKIGGYYIPKYNSLTSYLKRVTYRFGGYYKQTGLNLYGKDISDFGITFGVSLPGGLKSLSNLNLGVEIGQRGFKTQNLVKENYINLNLSFSLNDIWFIKRKIN